MKMKNRSPKHLLWAVKGVLDSLVQDKTLATYGYVAEHVGLHPHSTTLWSILGDIVKEDSQAGKPLRSAVVVNANTGQPGQAFLEAAVRNGHAPSPTFWDTQIQALGLPSVPPVMRPNY